MTETVANLILLSLAVVAVVASFGWGTLVDRLGPKRIVGAYITDVESSEEEQEGALEGLHSAATFVRTQLSKRLRMRRVPELHFQYDRMLDQAARIEQLLREALPDAERPPDDEGAAEE